MSFHLLKFNNNPIQLTVVSVVKWAQHIAEGRPLDFSQKQINDFGYSLILDIAGAPNEDIVQNHLT